MMDTIPVIGSAEDLDSAITYAEAHPDCRWYVKRRAVQLGLAEKLPEDWNAVLVASAHRSLAADDGDAMSDGSFAISDAASLHRAISAYGRARDAEATKRHIIARATALELTGMLPGEWQSDESTPEASDEEEAEVAEEELEPVMAAADRHVKTKAGAEWYDQAIGEVIRRDVYIPLRRVAGAKIKKGDYFTLNGKTWEAQQDYSPQGIRAINVDNANAGARLVKVPGGQPVQLNSRVKAGTKATLTPGGKPEVRLDAPKPQGGSDTWYVSAKGNGFTSNPSLAKKDKDGNPIKAPGEAKKGTTPAATPAAPAAPSPGRGAKRARSSSYGKTVPEIRAMSDAELAAYIKDREKTRTSTQNTQSEDPSVGKRVMALDRELKKLRTEQTRRKEGPSKAGKGQVHRDAQIFAQKRGGKDRDEGDEPWAAHSTEGKAPDDFDKKRYPHARVPTDPDELERWSPPDDDAPFGYMDGEPILADTNLLLQHKLMLLTEKSAKRTPEERAKLKRAPKPTKEQLAKRTAEAAARAADVEARRAKEVAEDRHGTYHPSGLSRAMRENKRKVLDKWIVGHQAKIDRAIALHGENSKIVQNQRVHLERLKLKRDALLDEPPADLAVPHTELIQSLEDRVAAKKAEMLASQEAAKPKAPKVETAKKAAETTPDAGTTDLTTLPAAKMDLKIATLERWVGGQKIKIERAKMLRLRRGGKEEGAVEIAQTAKLEGFEQKLAALKAERLRRQAVKEATTGKVTAPAADAGPEVKRMATEPSEMSDARLKDRIATLQRRVSGQRKLKEHFAEKRKKSGSKKRSIPEMTATTKHQQFRKELQALQDESDIRAGLKERPKSSDEARGPKVPAQLVKDNAELKAYSKNPGWEWSQNRGAPAGLLINSDTGIGISPSEDGKWYDTNGGVSDRFYDAIYYAQNKERRGKPTLTPAKPRFQPKPQVEQTPEWRADVEDYRKLGYNPVDAMALADQDARRSMRDEARGPKGAKRAIKKSEASASKRTKRARQEAKADAEEFELTEVDYRVMENDIGSKLRAMGLSNLTFDDQHQVWSADRQGRNTLLGQAALYTNGSWEFTPSDETELEPMRGKVDLIDEDAFEAGLPPIPEGAEYDDSEDDFEALADTASELDERLTAIVNDGEDPEGYGQAYTVQMSINGLDEGRTPQMVASELYELGHEYKYGDSDEEQKFAEDVFDLAARVEMYTPGDDSDEARGPALGAQARWKIMADRAEDSLRSPNNTPRKTAEVRAALDKVSADPSKENLKALLSAYDNYFPVGGDAPDAKADMKRAIQGLLDDMGGREEAHDREDRFKLSKMKDALKEEHGWDEADFEDMSFDDIEMEYEQLQDFDAGVQRLLDERDLEEESPDVTMDLRDEARGPSEPPRAKVSDLRPIVDKVKTAHPMPDYQIDNALFELNRLSDENLERARVRALEEVDMWKAAKKKEQGVVGRPDMDSIMSRMQTAAAQAKVAKALIEWRNGMGEQQPLAPKRTKKQSDALALDDLMRSSRENFQPPDTSDSPFVNVYDTVESTLDGEYRMNGGIREQEVELPGGYKLTVDTGEEDGDKYVQADVYGPDGKWIAEKKDSQNSDDLAEWVQEVVDAPAPAPGFRPAETLSKADADAAGVKQTKTGTFRSGGTKNLGEITAAKGSEPERFVPKRSLADGTTPTKGMNVIDKDGRNGTVAETYQAYTAVRWDDGTLKVVTNSKLNEGGTGSGSAPHVGGRSRGGGGGAKAVKTNAPAAPKSTRPPGVPEEVHVVISADGTVYPDARNTIPDADKTVKSLRGGKTDASATSVLVPDGVTRDTDRLFVVKMTDEKRSRYPIIADQAFLTEAEAQKAADMVNALGKYGDGPSRATVLDIEVDFTREAHSEKGARNKRVQREYAANSQAKDLGSKDTDELKALRAKIVAEREADNVRMGHARRGSPTVLPEITKRVVQHDKDIAKIDMELAKRPTKGTRFFPPKNPKISMKDEPSMAGAPPEWFETDASLGAVDYLVLRPPKEHGGRSTFRRDANGDWRNANDVLVKDPKLKAKLQMVALRREQDRVKAMSTPDLEHAIRVLERKDKLNPAAEASLSRMKRALKQRKNDKATGKVRGADAKD